MKLARILCMLAIIDREKILMLNKLLTTTAVIMLLVASQQASACLNHLYVNPDNYGFFGRSALKFAGLSPPEPVFKLEHPHMKKVEIGKKTQMTVVYERPWFSKNVQMELSSTNGVKLQRSNIPLDDYDGSVNINFSLEQPGYNMITLKVSGEHKGETLAYSRVVYVHAKKPATKNDTLQLSIR